MLTLTITWLLPLLAIGFLAGVIFRPRYHLAGALAVALACLAYIVTDKPGATPASPLYLALCIPAFLGAYAGGALFGRFVQSEVKGRPVMLGISVLTVAFFLAATTTSTVYH